MIAALFVATNGVYFDLPGVDPWDERRDARLYDGPWPVIAHPPCRTWSRLRHFACAPADEHALAITAIEMARKWGGVVEHPEGSAVFRECGCPTVHGFPDRWGGWTIRIDQFHFWHRARKRTILYIVGTTDIPPMPYREGEPTHTLDRGGRYPRRKSLVSKRERSATPPAFATWLVELASRCGRDHWAGDHDSEWRRR